jgi:hypothetical protein
MPLTIAQLLADVEPVEVHFRGETVNAKYKPSVITPALFARINADTYDKDAIVDVLAQALVGWDLAGDDGQPVPITEPSLMELPTKFLRTVYRGILADTYVSKN